MVSVMARLNISHRRRKHLPHMVAAIDFCRILSIIILALPTATTFGRDHQLGSTAIKAGPVRRDKSQKAGPGAGHTGLKGHHRRAYRPGDPGGEKKRPGLSAHCQ